MLRAKLSVLTQDMDALREYVLKDYLLLYALIGGAIYLLAVRHQRQLSFDFEGHWGRQTKAIVLSGISVQEESHKGDT
ncbi:hypothetical protein [Propionivibrio sp.]|uniref:hypothetical protein n=1 Tax=Propionivibrio sp. TaxID=2212460 RepID=UPI003BF3FF33